MKSLITLAILATAVTFGCATDPNKQVTDAKADHNADVSATDQENAKLAGDQAQDHAALDSAHEKEDASMQKQAVDDASKFNKKLGDAEANVVEARRTFKASAMARLEALDAKVSAMETKRAAKKATEPGIATLRKRTADAKASVAGLDTVSDASWFTTKQNVEASLATLENDCKDVEARL